MKIKLDENLPARLTPVLQGHGHDVDTVPEEQLSGRTDAEIWQAVSAEGRFLITQDMDFSIPANSRPAHTPVCCLSVCANRVLTRSWKQSTPLRQRLPIGAAASSYSLKTRYGSNVHDD